MPGGGGGGGGGGGARGQNLEHLRFFFSFTIFLVWNHMESFIFEQQVL